VHTDGHSSDAARRERMRALILAAQRQASDANRQPIVVVGERSPDVGSSAASAGVALLDSPAPVTIPGYQLLREVHRGGQGVVYEAIQQSTRRRVAIKVMREGPFAGRAERARFEREVQILAQLKHPNIVTIHDSGVAAGHAYVVMDLVEGRPLDRHVAGCAPADVLRLFTKVCEAIHAAHLRGVIHRDLKPGNVLIDPAGEPRVLDFGLAKLADGDPPSSSAPTMTATGQFVGSLPWCSPEQADGAAIDLRTDVYSLGVMLYQCLTGKFPYDVIGNMRDVLDRIIRAEPIPPSRVVRSSALQRPALRRPALRRRFGLQSRALHYGINDEVETIVLKCLAKVPERRYQSAGELARDLRRYLAGEPIEAKRDALTYVLRKQLTRHKLPVAIAAAFLLVVFGGLATSLTFWQQAGAQRDEARREQQRAQREAAKHEAVNQFLQDMLAKANRGEQGGNPNVTVREVVDAAARELTAGTLHYPPEVEAAVRDTIATTYRALGLYEDALPLAHDVVRLCRELYGNEHLAVATALHNLGTLLLYKGDYAAAEPPLRQALEQRRELLGGAHEEVAATQMKLGALLRAKGDYTAAEPLLREALEQRQKSPAEHDLEVSKGLNELGLLLRATGKLDEAGSLLRQALEMRRKLHGDEHLDVATSANDLALLLRDKGQPGEAEPLFREALALYRRLLGDEHPYVATAMSNLAMVINDRGAFAEAEGLYREALLLNRKFLGEDHPSVAATLINFGTLLLQTGDLDGAEQQFLDALAIYRRTLGDEHPNVATLLHNLGALLRTKGDYARAEQLFRDVLTLRRKLLGAQHPAVAASLQNLAVVLTDQGHLDEAEPLARQALAMRQSLHGPEHPEVAKTLNILAGVLRERRDYVAAEPLFREALAMRRRLLGDRHPEAADSLAGLGGLLRDAGHPAAAEPILREALDIYETLLPAGHATSAATQVDLGATLTRLERFAEAEEILLAAYGSLAANRLAPSPSVQKAVRAILQLYEAWDTAEPGQGYAEKAEPYRTLLAPSDPPSK